METTTTVPAREPIRMTIMILPPSPPSVGPAPVADVTMTAPNGWSNWPEGEPTWEDAEWQ